MRMFQEGLKRRALANYRQGQQDRRDGKPCLSANGVYLDGWYSPEGAMNWLPMFLTETELRELENELENH